MKKITILLITILCTVVLQAQENRNFTFNHIALSVKSLDKSAEFLATVMQLREITNKTKIEGIRWFAIGEGNELHLVPIIKEPITINKAVHFALSTSNFDTFVKVLVSKDTQAAAFIVEKNASLLPLSESNMTGRVSIEKIGAKLLVAI